MKGKVNNMKKVNIEPIMFSRKGAGRIDENIPIDLLEYVTPKSAMTIDNTPVCYIPKQITVSEEIGGTISTSPAFSLARWINRYFSN